MSDPPPDASPPSEPGKTEGQDALFAALYDELRRIARRELQSGAGVTLSAHTLLHETYVKMQQRGDIAFADRPRFLAYAARVMRNLVIDYARHRQAQKRGGAFEITSLPTVVPEQVPQAAELERLGDAIDAIATLDSSLAELVNLRFFCGFSFGEIGTMRGVSERTVQRDWEKARMLLRRALEGRDFLSE
jgi:RNA polymerase sigma factor (TIGR02999 family)